MNPINQILQGDCLSVLKTLPNEYVQCVITSPPYFGLRDYGTAKWTGGDPACDHLLNRLSSDKSTLHDKPELKKMQTGIPYAKTCGKCGAIREDSQIGLEETPDAYVAKLVEVFREVRRVLRNDGTVWLNLGDSYASVKSRYSSRAHTLSGKDRGEPSNHNKPDLYGNKIGLKDKDLIGIPWRVAFALQGFAIVPFKSFSVWADELRQAREARDWEAVEIIEGKLRCMDLLTKLQADGWYLRQDIIWHKPNPMPESVTDRCTKAHEYVFLLTKSQRYFYDAEAVKEGITEKYLKSHYQYLTGKIDNYRNGERNLKGMHGAVSPTGRRNRRSVWTITTRPYKGAHFATFPPKLVEPCILAGSSDKACPKCGKAWKRVLKKGSWISADTTHPDRPAKNIRSCGRLSDGNGISPQKTTGSWGFGKYEKSFQGFSPSCSCGVSNTAGSIVLDPFAGSGTTLAVAKEHGRNYIGIELNPEYIKLAEERLNKPVKPSKQPIISPLSFDGFDAPLKEAA